MRVSLLSLHVGLQSDGAVLQRVTFSRGEQGGGEIKENRGGQPQNFGRRERHADCKPGNFADNNADIKYTGYTYLVGGYTYLLSGSYYTTEQGSLKRGITPIPTI